MECNKDEAKRAYEIAERKFLAQDMVGAIKFARKASQLYPLLEGLTQFTTVVEVHTIAQKKMENPSFMDWYGILQVDPFADESTIRKHYRKLALLLHPDKNKCAGAEAAFKLVSEAWTILSDKSKKAAHDSHQNVNKTRVQEAFHKPTKPTFSSMSKPKSSSSGRRRRTPTNVKQTSRAESPCFWTTCSFCKIHYEFPRIYKGQRLCCPVCVKVFMATEVSVTFGTEGEFKEMLFKAKEAFMHKMANPSHESNPKPPSGFSVETGKKEERAKRIPHEEVHILASKGETKRVATHFESSSEPTICDGHPCSLPLKKSRADGEDSEKATRNSIGEGNNIGCNAFGDSNEVRFDMHSRNFHVKTNDHSFVNRSESEDFSTKLPSVSIMEAG